jgi:hypothetical protein
MTLGDLEHTLGSVLKSGQIGSPVALRIHATLPEGDLELRKVIGVFTTLIRLVADDSQGQLRARQHPSGRQVSVLWNDVNGRTVFISVMSAPMAQQGLQVLVVGNHGIARLSGGELWNVPNLEEEPPHWREAIDESLKRGTSVAVKTS